MHRFADGRMAGLVTAVAISTMLILASCGNEDARIHGAQAAASPTFELTPTFIAGTVTPAAPITPVLEPTPTPWTPVPSDPFNYTYSMAYGVPPFSADALVSVSDIIATGRVAQILPSHWTTSDGSRPVDPWHTVPDQYTIVTPVVINLDVPPLLNRPDADLSSSQLVIATEGGQVGEDSVTTNMTWDNYVVGDLVLVSVSTMRRLGPQGLVQTEVGPGWATGMQWVLAADGTATSVGGTLQTTDLISQIQAAVQAIPAATPVAPSTPSAVATP